MLYRKPLNKLQNLKKKQRFRVWEFSCSFLGIILFSWVALSQQPVTQPVDDCPDAQPWRQGMIKDFEAENPGIRINIIEGPNATNLLEDLYTPLYFGWILMTWSTWTSSGHPSLPLLVAARPHERISKQELAAFSPKDVEGGRWRQAVPNSLSALMWMLYYRQDLLPGCQKRLRIWSKFPKLCRSKTRLVGLRLAGSPIRRIGGDVCWSPWRLWWPLLIRQSGSGARSTRDPQSNWISA